ncbi:MAG: hypothetical protein AAF420_04175, partial [Pseudomonadota bacterium]
EATEPSQPRAPPLRIEHPDTPNQVDHRLTLACYHIALNSNPHPQSTLFHPWRPADTRPDLAAIQQILHRHTLRSPGVGRYFFLCPVVASQMPLAVIGAAAAIFDSMDLDPCRCDDESGDFSGTTPAGECFACEENHGH